MLLKDPSSLFPTHNNINGRNWDEIKNVYTQSAAPVLSSAPAVVGSYINIGAISNIIKNTAQNSKEKKADSKKKQVINVTNLPIDVKVIYEKRINKEGIIKLR